MDKPTNKKMKFNDEDLHSLVIGIVKIKYGVSKRYVNMSIAGHRVSDTAEAIVNDYKKLRNAISTFIDAL